ncbi:MAG: polysaccharide deacetylase family protein [Myxococcota bacterium]|nr:polysaccharide deacetylase family protein [Myxococcota bacterium]
MLRAPRTRALPPLAALLAVAALGTGCYALGEGRGTLGIFGDRDPRVLYRVDTEVPALALTIDDGPHPQSTSRILAVLEDHRAKATFFVTTSNVSGNEAVLDAIVAGGHEIGNHHVRDEPSIGLTREAFERGLVHAHDRLSAWTSPRWFRPASGWYDGWMLDILDAHHYRAALGTVYPLDAQIPSVGLASWWIGRQAGPGAIIILHDGGGRGQRTAQVLERILPRLGAQGLEVVSLSELVERAAPRPVPGGAGGSPEASASDPDSPGNPEAWDGPGG